MADGRHVGKYSKCHNSPTNRPTGTQIGWSQVCNQNNEVCIELTRWHSSECSWCIVHTASQLCCAPCHTDCSSSQAVLIYRTVRGPQSLTETTLSLRPRLTTTQSCAVILSYHTNYFLLVN